ncbi:MAG: 1,6-anhydro-N-acetylmuramyl-L-alanine amidase AmpD [Cellvibrionaceae bacterium]
MSDPLVPSLNSRFVIEQGWLSSARRVPSPNCNERPLGDKGEINLLVIHNISLPPCEFGGGYIDQLFQNCLNPNEHPYFQGIAHLTVSAHLLIDRQGAVTQYVPFTSRAWHAGQSSYEGRENCNDFSIGIELEGDDNTPYTGEQYTVLAEITELLCQTYPSITSGRIAGHSDIAPERKTDPGPAFDWQRYLTAVKAPAK